MRYFRLLAYGMRRRRRRRSRRSGLASQTHAARELNMRTVGSMQAQADAR